MKRKSLYKDWYIVSAIIVLVVVLLVLYFTYNSELEEETTHLNSSLEIPHELIGELYNFSFVVYETNETITDGEIFFDGVSKGFIKNGSFIYVEPKERPGELRINGTYKGQNFDFNYTFPYDYDYEYNRNLQVYIFEESIEIYNEYLKVRSLDWYPDKAEPHWRRMPVKYYINLTRPYHDKSTDSQDERLTRKVKAAFGRITEKVPSITFEEVNSNDEADIVFYFTQPRFVKEDEYAMKGYNFFSWIETTTVGLAVPVVWKNIILSAEIFLTPEEECLDSNLELHEILHTFRVPHSNSTYGAIMSPYEGGCDPGRKMKDETINYLKNIYD